MIPKDYVNLKILGRNANGDITKKVRSLLDQKLYVIKSLGSRKLSENQKKILNILNDDKCPFIVNHYPLDEINNEIKTDFINNGDLLEYVNTFNDLGQPIEENILLNIFSQCAESIKYLHDKRIIHRNIRLENFYMTEDMDIKLGNFIYVTFKNGIEIIELEKKDLPLFHKIMIETGKRKGFHVRSLKYYEDMYDFEVL